MRPSLKFTALFSGAIVIGAWLGATPHISSAGASAMQAPFDPKKKKPGESCKSADECQKHHTCEKEGDKSVCKAPPPPSLPPGAVT